ncbi:MAG TPA: DUF3553 domain-containing protein [Nitrospiria bacterium]
MRRLFLKLGDRVFHRRFPQWGSGEVVEQKASTLSGGTCLVRVVFRDGVERSFINDLSDYNCCYYNGVRLWEEPSPGKKKFQSFL